MTIQYPEGAALHPYHCPLDGIQLYEAALGTLRCPKCDRELLPTSDPRWEEDHSEQVMHMLSWVEPKLHQTTEKAVD